MARRFPGGTGITRRYPPQEGSAGSGGGSSERSIDLTPASSVSYSVTDYKLVGSGGIVEGWRVPQYASPVPTVTESSGALVLSAAISPNTVRPGYDVQWSNTGPAIMLPKMVVGDFDLQLKVKSDAGRTYLSVGPGCWMLNENYNYYAGGIWTMRGLNSDANAHEHASSIGNGAVKMLTNLGVLTAWTTSTWVRLQRVGATITHSRRTGDSDAWAQLEQQTWDRSGGAAWLGICLGARNGETAEFTVERIIATYTEHEE